MKKLLKYSWILLTFLIGGCASSSSPESELAFNPNKKKIVRIGNSVYYIPRNAAYGKFPDKSWLKEYQSYGLDNCRMGDVLWRANATDKMVDEAKAPLMKNNPTEDEINKYKITMIGVGVSGFMGCEHPLTKKEIDYHEKRIAYQKEQIYRQIEYYQRERLIRALNRPVRHDVDVNVDVDVFHY